MSTPNRLSRESSPYLQQHAHNPVDWYPWGEEALARATKEAKPIFLSIGYSACHWCHVMERESFEDAETARLMNENFINIKVDREERQDLDHIYMSAVQALTRHGGWPMSVFLTPELEPFYGGTYFPPEDRMGLPSFKRILTGVANAWAERRADVMKSAKHLTLALEEMSESDLGGETPLSLTMLENAGSAIARNFDPYHGGFGTAPKFFHTMDLRVALRQSRRGNPNALSIVTITLDHLARGGIYDQIGGGFHRYSTDQKWLVPHFEKMLYDNALLVETYLEAFQATGNPEHSRIARETLDYVRKEMTSPEGGFYSTQDADSEGVEGKFYVWSREEILSLLGKDLGERFCHEYGVSQEGNWEGTNILHRPSASPDSTAPFEPARRKLFEARAKRIAPFRDEKVLVAWNGLMIHAMAQAYQVLSDEKYLFAARNAATFAIEKMGAQWDGLGNLQHAFKDGKSRFNAYLDDYAALAGSLITLYESDFDTRWLGVAKGLTEKIISEFWNEKNGAFFYTARHHEKLITRPRETQDGAMPSATALAITALVRLGKLTGQPRYLEIAEKSLAACGKLMSLGPTAAGQLLIALELLRGDTIEIFLARGESTAEFESVLRHIRSRFLPNKIVGTASAAQPSIDKRATAYVCQNFTCAAPLVGEAAIKEGI